MCLTGADPHFNLLPFPHPVLDETLAEEHDKSMFDEHLGLTKEAEDKSALAKPDKPETSITTSTEQTASSTGKFHEFIQLVYARTHVLCTCICPWYHTKVIMWHVLLVIALLSNHNLLLH